MAGVSTKEIKTRIRSMEATRQITKALEMVAASKLRRAQEQIQSSRPYFEILRKAIDNIVEGSHSISSPYLTARPVKKAAYIVIAGDRGLAGSYNAQLLRLVQSRISGQVATVLPIGKKAVDHFHSRKIPMLSENYAVAADISIGDCFCAAKQLSKLFLHGEFDEIYVAYTNFQSVLSQTPTIMQLLPLIPKERTAEGASCDFLYEPGATEVFEAIVPEYLGGILYGALCESRASEQAARRTAMDSATSNAEDMIADLSLKFNRARQAAITQEITEIVAGS